MKEVKVSIPDDKELVYDEESESYKLVPAIDIEKEKLLEEVQKDIDLLHQKYEPLLAGKFCLNINLHFYAYRSGNRKTVTHWVSNDSNFSIIDGEKCWHD